MSYELLGPEGARARLEELQAKIAAARPQPEFKPATTAPGAFPGVLQGELGKGSGAVTFGDSENFAPLSPFAGGATVSSGASDAIKSMIQRAASKAGIDAKLFDALVANESSYDPQARSSVGAMGLAQLMPETAKQYGVTDITDPQQNLDAGARYLSDMLKKFGDPKLALAAYNAGPGAVMKAGNQIPNYKETQNYVRKVMSLYQANSTP